MNNMDITMTIKNNKIVKETDREECDSMFINKEKAKKISKTIINETIPLENIIAVNGNIYVGNIIHGDVIELKSGLVI